MRVLTLICAIFALVLPASVQAQSPYSAAVTINGNAVTHFEIEQRALMLQVIGTLGDVEKQALNDLIDDRMRQQVARQMGFALTEDEINTGLTEFATRANLTSEQFIIEIEKAGVYAETFIDFVSAGLLWRKVVRSKFQSKAFVSEVELDTAMALGTTAIGASVLVSELVLPLPPGAEDQSLELATALSKSIRSFSEFEEAVLTYSAAPSRAKGGKLDWMPIGNLPPDIGAKIMTMGIGGVTPPVQLPNAVAIFQLRGIRDNREVAARTIGYDYATLLMPGGRSEATLKQANQLAGSIDTCEDLFAKSQNYPDEYFTQQVTPIAKTPKHIVQELANLDANEVSTNLTQGENGEFLVFLMLCGRTNSLSDGNREEVRNALFSQRMQAFSDGFLQELKGDAIILNK